MNYKFGSFLFISLSWLHNIKAFTSNSVAKTTSVKLFASPSSSSVSTTRRQWFVNTFQTAKTAAVVAGGSFASYPAVAGAADITNKIASSSALRKIKRSQKQLDDLELLVSNEDYEQIREALRVAPLTEVRKNCSILIKSSDEGSATQKSLEKTYQTFKEALEKIDSQCLLATRGRKVSLDDISSAYSSSVTALADFIKVADESLSTPAVQEEAPV